MPFYTELKFLSNFGEELDEGRRAMSKMSSFKMRGEEHWERFICRYSLYPWFISNFSRASKIRANPTVATVLNFIDSLVLYFSERSRCLKVSDVLLSFCAVSLLLFRCNCQIKMKNSIKSDGITIIWFIVSSRKGKSGELIREGRVALLKTFRCSSIIQFLLFNFQLTYSEVYGMFKSHQ